MRKAILVTLMALALVVPSTATAAVGKGDYMKCLKSASAFLACITGSQFTAGDVGAPKGGGGGGTRCKKRCKYQEDQPYQYVF